jgi:hypothetical protein
MSINALATFGVMLMAGMAAVLPSGCLHAKTVQATAVPGRPAVTEIEVSPANRTAPATARAFARLAVTRFMLPKAGIVEIVVTMRGQPDAPGKELGRIGLFPDKSFSVTDGEEPRQFLINLGSSCGDILSHQAPQLEVGLTPVNGDGAGASLTVGRTILECH